MHHFTCHFDRLSVSDGVTNDGHSELGSEGEACPFSKDPSGRYVVLYTFTARDENDVDVERGEFVTGTLYTSTVCTTSRTIRRTILPGNDENNVDVSVSSLLPVLYTIYGTTLGPSSCASSWTQPQFSTHRSSQMAGGRSTLRLPRCDLHSKTRLV